MLSLDTRVMGRFVDVVWYVLNVTPERGRGRSYAEEDGRICGDKLGLCLYNIVEEMLCGFFFFLSFFVSFFLLWAFPKTLCSLVEYSQFLKFDAFW